MGEHSREVLSERLGMSVDEIQALIDEHIVWEERPPIELG
jgi:hypothetical protein